MTEAAGADIVPEQATAYPRAYVWLAVGLLTAVLFLNTLDRMLLGILAEPIKADLRLDDAQFGLIAGLIFSVFYTLLGLPIGRLADRSDRPFILAGCIVLWSAMTAACGLAQTGVQLALARCGVGAGEAGCTPIAHSLIGEYVSPARRSQALGLLGAGGSLGVMFGLIVGGIVTARIGWRGAFITIGLPGALLALVIVALLREPRRGVLRAAASTQPAAPLAAALSALARNKVYLLLLVVAILCNGASTAITTWKSAYFMRTFSLPIDQVGVWLGLTGGVSGVVGMLLGGFLGGRGSVRRALYLTGACVTIGGVVFCAAFLIQDWRLAALLMIVPQILTNCWYAPVFAVLQTVVAPQLRAFAVAIAVLALGTLGNGLLISVAGLVSKGMAPIMGHASLRASLILMALLLSMGGAVMLIADRTLKAARPSGSAA